MIVPALITAGVLGALALSRETPPAPSSPTPLPPQMSVRVGDVVEVPAEPLGAQIAGLDAYIGQNVQLLPLPSADARITTLTVVVSEIDPRGYARGNVTGFNYTYPNGSGGATFPAGTTSFTTPYFPLANVTKVTSSRPGAPAPALPAGTPPLASLPAPAPTPASGGGGGVETLSEPLRSRAQNLMAMGTAASPFALDSLANEIDAGSPGHPVANALRHQADVNRALMPVQMPPTQPPVQGRPYVYGPYASRVGQMPSPARVFSPFAPFASAVAPIFHAASPHAQPPIPAAAVPLGAAEPRRRRVRCTAREGCLLYRSPSSLHPTGITIPSMTVAYVDREEGPWLYVRFGTQQGWASKDAFSTDFLPGAPDSISVQRGAVFYNPYTTRT